MDGNLEYIAPTTDFTCSGCHTWQFSLGKPRTRALWSGTDDATDWVTAAPDSVRIEKDLVGIFSFKFLNEFVGEEVLICSCVSNFGDYRTALNQYEYENWLIRSNMFRVLELFEIFFSCCILMVRFILYR